MKIWTIQISDPAKKQLKKLDKTTRLRILDYLIDRLEGCKNPRHFGEPLKGNKAGLWRYRVGDYRILCEIQDDTVIVMVLSMGHRKQIYA